MRRSPLSLMATAQGVYYLITGVWPLVSMGTFLFVTGPKTDLWLVRTVAILIAVIGATLLLAAFRDRVSPETVVLAVASAIGLAAVDVIYVSNGTISAVYLLDALAEGFLLLGWAIASLRERATLPKRAHTVG